MNLDIFNKLINDAKDSKFIQNFIKELEEYLEKGISQNSRGDLKEEISLINPMNRENKIISKYRDEMIIGRNQILNNYAERTLERGQMYYIYNQSSKMDNIYNLCICEKGKSHIVIETNKNQLPEGVTVGSVLRKVNEDYVFDAKATEEISKEIDEMKEKILEEQTQYLESKRIEGHIYEIGEKNFDRVWLYDITNGDIDGIEGVEEISFPEELLNTAKEGDVFIYENGKYCRSANK